MADNPNNSESISDRQVLMMLYQVNRDNQELYINQQWRVIYYAVLLYGAIFAVYLKLEDFKCYMYAAAVFIYVMSSVIICLSECSLCETRKADLKFREKKSLKIIEDIFGKPDHSKSSWTFGFLLSANFVSFVFLICAVCHYKIK